MPASATNQINLTIALIYTIVQMCQPKTVAKWSDRSLLHQNKTTLNTWL